MLNREEEIEFEKKIEKMLNDEHIFADYVVVSQFHDFIRIEIRIEGDWKHDHLRTEYLMDEKILSQFNYEKLVHNKQEVGESESDYYTAIHTWFVRELN